MYIFAGTTGYELMYPGGERFPPDALWYQFSPTMYAGAYRKALIEFWLKSSIPNNYTALIKASTLYR
jgi:hypothetical protein